MVNFPHIGVNWINGILEAMSKEVQKIGDKNNNGGN